MIPRTYPRERRLFAPKKAWAGRASALALALGVAVVACADAGAGPGGSGGTADPGAAWLQPASAAGQHVLLITTDTTRADRIGCYGHEEAKTPAIDGLAARGMRFDQAVTCVPLTTPAHASLLTGLYPPQHGVRNNGGAALSSELPSLAGILAEQEYATAAFVAAFPLDSRYGLARGFDLYDDTLATAGAFHALQERRADAVTDAAIAWLDQRDSERPFFVWAHYFDPHDPYSPPSPVPGVRDPYDAEIAYMDQHIGRLLKYLEGEGLDDNTLICLVGDHGESLGEHREPTHSRLLYEGPMRVPMIFAGPGVTPGVDGEVASVVDVLPTLLDALGLDALPRSDGTSLLAGAPAGRAVYMESLVPLLNNGWAPLYALRTRAEKFILAPRPEYYELEGDRSEADNTYSDAARAAELEQLLQERLSAWDGWATLPEEAPTSAGEDDSLAALGYVSGSSPEGPIGTLDPKDMMPTWGKILQAKALRARSAGRPAAPELDQALELLREVLEASPNDRAALEQLAKVHAARGETKEAIGLSRRFLALGRSADGHIMLGQLLLFTGAEDEAQRQLELAEELDPSHGGLWLARGDLALRRGAVSEARSAYEKAAEVDPQRMGQRAQERLRRLGPR